MTAPHVAGACTAASLAQLNTIDSTVREQVGLGTTQGDASRPWLLLGTLASLLSAAGALVLTQRLP